MEQLSHKFLRLICLCNAENVSVNPYKHLVQLLENCCGVFVYRQSGLTNNLFIVVQAPAEQLYSVHTMLVGFRCKLQWYYLHEEFWDWIMKNVMYGGIGGGGSIASPRRSLDCTNPL